MLRCVVASIANPYLVRRRQKRIDGDRDLLLFRDVHNNSGSSTTYWEFHNQKLSLGSMKINPCVKWHTFTCLINEHARLTFLDFFPNLHTSFWVCLLKLFEKTPPCLLIKPCSLIIYKMFYPVWLKLDKILRTINTFLIKCRRQNGIDFHIWKWCKYKQVK